MTYSVVIVLSRGQEQQDRRDVFQKALEGYCRQTYDHSLFEIVAVDSGLNLTDNEVAAYKASLETHDITFTYINHNLGNIGAAKGRNIGWKAADQGKTKHIPDIIYISDDDVVPPPDLFEELTAVYQSFPDAQCVGGICIPPFELAFNNPYAYYDLVIYGNVFPTPRKPAELYKQLPEPYISESVDEHPAYTGNISYKLDILKQLDGFNEEYPPFVYGEDSNLKERLLAHNAQCVFAPTRATHLAVYTWRRFIQQQKNRGAGAVYYKRTHNEPEQTTINIIMRIFATPTVLVKHVITQKSLKIAVLEAIAFYYRQVGKLQYRDKLPRRKPTLLFVDHLPLIGGAQIALLRHLQYINRSSFGIAVILSDLFPEFSKKFEALAVKVHEVSFPKLRKSGVPSLFTLPGTFFAMIRILRSERPDLVVINTERALYFCAPLLAFTKTRCVLIVRDYMYSRRLLKLLNPVIDAYIAVSTHIKEFYPLSSPKSTVIYVGSDMQTRLAAQPPEKLHALRETLKLTQNTLVIGFIGRIIDWKGPLLLLDAYHSMLRHTSLPPTKLVFVGTGPALGPLKNKINEYHLSEQVYVAGFDEEIEKWYALLDIYVHASIEDEPYATSVIEAALAKNAIIATNTGGTPEFIVDNETGILVEASIQEMGAALYTLVSDATLRKQLAIQAYQKASKENIEDVITKRFEEVYQKVLQI